MMRKNRNTISLSLVPKSTMRKLCSFFLLVFLLFSNLLFAESENPAGKIVDSSDAPFARSEESVIHIKGGAFIYGDDSFSQKKGNSFSSNHEPPKKRSAKKAKTIVGIKEKAKVETKSPKPKNTVFITEHSSRNSFQSGAHSTDVGTINVNNTSKSDIICCTIQVRISSVSFFKNSLYTYSVPYVQDTANGSCFTRPPPFA